MDINKIKLILFTLSLRGAPMQCRPVGAWQSPKKEQDCFPRQVGVRMTQLSYSATGEAKGKIIE
jgi:hypothetical protein